MTIEYDKYYKSWVVWEKDKNVKFEVFKGLKRDCKKYVKSRNNKNEKR